MIVQAIKVNDCTPQTIVIGRRGTYDTLQIAFDLSYLVESYGNGVAVLAVKRSQDSSAYPAVTSQEDDLILWTVSETDTFYVGAGEAQLMWYVDGGLAKTIIYPMVVMRDILSTAEEAPDAYQTWVDDLTALGAETLQNAQDAAQSASDAEDAKDDAVAAKEAAEAALEEFTTPTASATTLAAGSQATAEYSDGNFAFGIPRGADGSPGTPGAPGADGVTPDFSIGTVTTLEPTQPATATITGTPEAPVLNLGIPKGAKGDPGQGSGSVDSVNGQTGDVVLDAGDLEFDDTETYAAGSVGAELSQQKNAINQKQDAPATAGTAGQVLGLDSNLDPVWVNQSGGGDTSNCAPIIINTASGDIATFTDGADNRQIKKIVGTIVPVQSGTGDPSPDNVRPISGRTGANIFDASNVSRLSAKNAQFDILPIQNGTGTPTPTNVRNIDPGLSFTLDNGTVVDIYRGDITFHVDGTATLISRYANRIFDGSELFTGWFNETRHIATSASIQDASHEDGTGGYCNRYKIYNVGQNLTNVDTYCCAFGSNRSSHIFYVKDERYSTLEEFNTGCVGLQIVYPLFTPVTYELSEAETVRAFAALGVRVKGLSINWQTEAGTIYGGTVTLNEDGSADVVADKAAYDMGDLNYSSYASLFICPIADIPTFAEQQFDGWIYCSCYKPTFAATLGTINASIQNNQIMGRKTTKELYIKDTRFTSVADFKAAVADQSIVVPLENPITYHFDNIGELYTYFGANNVWIDTGSITECDYPADTKLYIDGLTAPDEDMIANANIASGKYFVVNNQLYLSTAAIAAGASIVPGTNCTATNLAEALNALNT